MRLVGATNWFIRGPFIVEGIIIGFLASLLAVIVLYLGTEHVSGFLKNFLDGYNIFLYLKTNILRIFAFLLATGVLLSTVSSLVAVRKYLKV